MGKAKFVILAAIILLVQTGTGHGIIKVNDQAKIKNVVAADDCDWPMFGRTPDGNRVVPDGCGISNLDFGEKWSKKIGSRSAFDPIIADGKMFVSFQDNTLYCIDLKNGNILWNYKSTWYIGTPVFNDGKVYFGYSGKFYCLNANDGIVKWQVDVPQFKGFASNICIYENMFYFTGDGRFFCIDAGSGKMLWNMERFFQGHNFQGVAIAYGRVYVRYSQNEIYCLDPHNGELKWSYKTNLGTFVVDSILVAADNKIFTSIKEGLVCLDALSGKLIWKNKYCNEGVVYYKKQLFACWGLLLVVMDPGNGDLLWKSDQLRVDREPIVSGNNVFCNGVRAEDNMFIFDITTKKMVKKIVHPELESFLISGNCLYLVNNDGFVCCYEPGFKNIPSKIEISNVKPNIIDFCTTIHLSAKVFDQNNQEIKDAKVTWSVEPKDIGTIDEMGIFKPSKLGLATITCKCGDISAFVVVNVVDPIFVDTEGIRIDILKPFEKVSKKFTLTNNGDLPKDIILSSSIGTVAVNPSSLTLAAGESREIEVSSQINQIEPIPDTEFTITITNGSCIKQIKGILTQSWPFTCISVSPQTLDYGQIRRGNSKTIQLTFVSKVKTVLTISPSEQWITILPSKTIAIEADTPTVVDFKINASSLPAASKLSANVIIETNLNYCDKIAIPLTVMTEDSITIKLQVNSKNATINDQEKTLDVPAQLVGGRTMVPLRFISESFGCSIEWDAKTQKISIIRYDITVNLWIGKDFVDVNGTRIKIDSPPVIIGGRTMVPLRFIAEPFGAQVQWDAQTKGITIIWPKP